MTSADILFLVGTCAIIFLTGFLCMALYYVIRILRRIHRTLDAVEKKAGYILDSWKELYSRLLGLRTSFDIIASGCKAMFSLYQRRMAQDDSEERTDENYDVAKKPKKRKGRKNEAVSEEG